MCFLSDSCFFFLIVGAVAVHASPAGCPVEGRSVRTPPRGGNVSPINQFLETEVRAPGVNISKYLTDYGYMSAEDEGDEAKETEAIYQFQKLANVNPTGRLDLETVFSMNKPRCANEDKLPGKHVEYSKFFEAPVEAQNDSLWRFKLGPTGKWKDKDITWKINRYTNDLPRETVHSTMQKAFQAWATVSGLTFREATQWEDPDFDIQFVTGDHGDGSAFDGPGGVLAHCFYPQNGRAHFDDDETWSVGINEPNAINLEWVAIHEFGHGLGLDHSEIFDAVMYPFYPSFTETINLRPDDIDGIQTLYGPGTGGNAATQAPVGTTPRPTTVPSRGHSSSHGPFAGSSSQPRSCPVPTMNAAFVDHLGQVQMISDDEIWSFTDRGVNTLSPTQTWRYNMYYPRDVNAVVTVDSGLTYVFSGMHVFEFDYRSQFPALKYVEYMGISTDTKIDAALLYPTNKAIYIFQGTQYYKVDPTTLEIEPSYPRPIYLYWSGVPDNLDAALAYKGDVYVIKGDRYWKFDTVTNEVPAGYPRSVNEDWFNCDSQMSGNIQGEP